MLDGGIINFECWNVLQARGKLVNRRGVQPREDIFLERERGLIFFQYFLLNNNSTIFFQHYVTL